MLQVASGHMVEAFSLGGGTFAWVCVRPRSIANAARPEPPDGAAGRALEGPSVLVHEPVMERTHEREVVEVGRPAA